MLLRRFLIAVTIFITLLRWNVILYIFDNLHVVSSLLDQCSKNEHMQNFLMHMGKLKKSNTYVQTSPQGPKLLAQFIKNRLNKVLVQNGLTETFPNNGFSGTHARAIAYSRAIAVKSLPSNGFTETFPSKSNQINIRLIRWQITTTDTDAKSSLQCT